MAPSSRPECLFLVVTLATIAWLNSWETPSTPPGDPTNLELSKLEAQIRALEYEKVVRARAVQDAKVLLREYNRQAGGGVRHGDSSSNFAVATEQVRDRCGLWAYEHGVVPGASWGSLPEPLRADWMTLRCHEHLPHAALPSAATGSLPPLPAQAPPAAPLATVPSPPSRRGAPHTVLPVLLPAQPAQPMPYTHTLSSGGGGLGGGGVASDPLRRVAAAGAAVPEYRGYTFWSSDFHISPIADLKDLFKPLGMHIIDKSLSGHCHLKKTCQTNLKVLNKANGINLGKCPNQLRRDFFRAYSRDPQMKKVDVMLCHHAAGLCEAFMPLNKSLVVVASTRYEIGRHDPQRWRLWNQNLRAMAAHPRNVVAANNLYDAMYVRYFTGLADVPVLPNYCAYTHAAYKPTRPQVLIGPGRGINDALYGQLMGAAKRQQPATVKLARVRDLYPHFEYSDLAAHPAIVLIPYQVSIMSIFEYYRMAIPLFVPSTDLLAAWQAKHRIMNERTWNGVFKKFKRKSDIERHPQATFTEHDPNNEFDHEAIKYWIAFADFYQWPHITTFESFEDLLAKLRNADLPRISNAMKAYNTKTKAQLVAQWQGIFHRMFQGLPPAAQEPRLQLMDFDAAMKSKYGATVSRSCVGDTYSEQP